MPDEERRPVAASRSEDREGQAMNLTGVWRIVEMDLWDADCLVSAVL